VIGLLALTANGEQVSNPVSYLRVERGGGSQDILLGTEGADPVGAVTPPARLVGPDRR
jgi:hypothetical protein